MFISAIFLATAGIYAASPTTAPVSADARERLSVILMNVVQYSSEQNAPMICRALLEKGATLSARDRHGKNALDIARAEPASPMKEQLLLVLENPAKGRGQCQ
jgi:hypothetical protein